jgi:hypothetical protein
MSEAAFGGLAAAGILVPVVVSILAYAYAEANDSSQLTPREACLFSAIWLFGAIGFGCMVAIGVEYHKNPEFVSGYAVIGGIILGGSLILLAYAILHFSD